MIEEKAYKERFVEKPVGGKVYPILIAENPLAKKLYQFRIRGKSFFNEGETIDDATGNLYLIVSGRFAIQKTKEEIGQPFTLAVAGPGDIIGWDGLAPNTIYSSSAFAERDSKVIPFSPYVAARLLFPKRRTDASDLFAEAFLETIAEAELTGDVMKYGDVNQRTALAVWKYSPFARRVHTPDQPKRWSLGGEITHNQLAQAAGTSRETLEREETGLAFLERKGAIEKIGEGENSRIEIVNSEALAKLAHTRRL